jgi:hypothetical protein
MMLQFREWLFVENTVSQMLKSNPDQPTVANLQTEVRSYLKRFGWARTIPDPQLDPLVKLVTYWLLLMHTASKKTAAAPDSTVKHEDMWTQDMIQLWIRTLTNDYADYLATILTEQPQIARSKFNNPQYKPDNLKADSVAWHEKIATQKRKVADPGRRVDLPGMPAGYYWVSLDRASCDKEAEAMGHCGNAGFKEGDIVWSMRDPKGVPHLTFIVNNKMLGESKGFANNKPESKYHPHIIAFLLGQDQGSDIVQYIRGGGYKPEANFHISDLEKGMKEQLLAKKPQLNDYFMYLKALAGGDEKKWKKAIDDTFNFEFNRVDVNKGEVVVKEFGDIQQLIDWLKEETDSKLDQLPDFDNMESFDFHMNLDDALSHFKNDADKENEALMDQIIAALEGNTEKDDEDEDYDDHDVAWACEQDDEVENAVRWSADDGWRSGSEGAAYKHVLHFFKQESDHDGNGFMTDATYGGGWYIKITLKDLEELYKSIDDSTDWANGYQEISKYINYKYDQPYGGHSEFDDDAYNERLKEMLGDVLNGLKKDEPVSQEES